MKPRRSKSFVAVWIGFVALAASGLVLGLGVSSALSQTVPTETTTPTETEPPPPPDPDPINPPPPPNNPPPPSQPPPTGDPSPPPSSSGAVANPTKQKKKPAKPERRPKKERPAATSFAHDPRDPPPVVVDGELASGPAFSPGSSGGTTGTQVIALFLVAGLVVGALLLALAAIPAWVVRPARASAIIDHWRVQIAATGLSALSMALIIFVLTTSGV
jgi:hypothetical protein